MRIAKNIFLVGSMGAGKTSVGKFLAKSLNKKFLDSDSEIEKSTGVSLSWIFDIEGEKGFRERERKKIAELVQLNNIVLATGGGCVETSGVPESLRQHGLIIYLHVELPTQLRRLKKDKRRPQLQVDNPEMVLLDLWDKREACYENLADFQVLTDSRSVQDVCSDILRWLKTQVDMA